MRNLPKPTDTHSDVFDECINTLRSTAKANFVNLRQTIMDAGVNYDNLMVAKRLYTLRPSNTIGPNISSLQMKNLYTNKLAKLGQPARAFYDRWKASVPHERCPLCGVRQVKTLDHYLPKAKFPIFSILPFNLIPACRDCNTDKLEAIASCYAEETIHPYYDKIDNEQWLFADLHKTVPATFSFVVDAPKSWDPNLLNRVNRHLDVFKLRSLYISHAGEELSNINGQLKIVFSTGGASAVKKHIKEGLDSRLLANKNSWQTAMYKAMYDDVWFHSNCYY